MAEEIVVGILDFNILKSYVIDKSIPLKILTPTLSQIIYYGWSNETNGSGINHSKMLEMLPTKIAAKDIGLAADLMNRPIRPPRGITIHTAGETLMSRGYMLNRQTLMWVISTLDEIMRQKNAGSVTVEQ